VYRVVHSIIVIVEHDMLASKIVAPAKNCMQNREHLLDLDVVVSKTVWAASRKPFFFPK
jgi:hypothetical protein